ncbi:ankyrin repeat domain-containing protein [Algibacter amylolyticus]|uniref:Ankyrin repeat domain-containing protein n=1 Tax=Algibacter amylolyticus TaxID=1608400 RepID=A0A5M7B427_9FLAO|nr:ankyrin repeat domain-containing protein [Algibacter amylolyticus]KAA5824162.1 ankyrin repeat domain-containing protein [Algibacter amylolyticus]MBB5269721.1 ankyrin repeat protein [Algibacter amylolyticus]TSJ74639.1 ankyrin repeat domain-containing protein [Algibacter amylolyticus]
MKKSIIISAIALCFSLVIVNATPVDTNVSYEAAPYFKVNSFCVSIAKGDLETVQKLISRGADVNEKSNGMTPIMYAAKFNRTDILELLIKHGANLKAKCDKNKTALKYAKLHGAIDAEVILVKALDDAKKAKKRK